MRSIAKVLVVVMFVAVFVFSIGVQQAKADALLFPYFKTGNGAYTFISLQTPVATDVTVAYYYDKLDTSETECIHEDQIGTMTNFDLHQYEISNALDLKAIFGDTSAVTNLPLLVSNTQGFAIYNAPLTSEGDFYGQAIVVDTASGLVSAYKAMNNPASTDAGNWNHVATSATSFMMSNYPSTVASTSWYVLATGTGMFNSVPSWNGAVILSNGFDIVWDRDEHPVSGDLTTRITCFDFVKRDDIMQTGQVINSDNGGVWWELATPVTGTGATGAIMAKIESTTALGGPMAAISIENKFPNNPY